ncbi:Gag-Pol polyprotein [Leucoagaricus sp. SymC.cos]|nr:Gag-Pol polyprotein [Leucoagaricus sp. SymC.cos]
MGQGEAEWRIKEFKQGRMHIQDFLIEFEVLKRKAKTDDSHALFLLKKHIQPDIIKTIMGYSTDYQPTSYMEWMSSISTVEKRYKFTELKWQHTMSSGVTYGERGQLMEIGHVTPQTPHHIDKRNPKCYSCGKFGYIAKNCPEPKNTCAPANTKVQCYNCGKFRHISEYCRAP